MAIPTDQREFLSGIPHTYLADNGFFIILESFADVYALYNNSIRVAESPDARKMAEMAIEMIALQKRLKGI